MTTRSPFLALVVILAALWGGAEARGQCEDSTTTLWYQTTAVRLNGNAVRLDGTTQMTGDYYNWWYPGGDVSFYFDGALNNISGWQRVVTLGASFDLGYTPTPQTYGPGQYQQYTAHDAFTPYCSYNGQNTFSAMCGVYGCAYPPPWNSSASMSILRPARPDYGPGGHTVFFLGAGISYDGSTPITRH